MKLERIFTAGSKSYEVFSAFGYEFPCEVTKSGKTGKMKKDLIAACSILEKGIENLTSDDKLALLKIYSVAYHKSGKIEGIFSFDSTATNCEFCQKMRKLAEKNPQIICGKCYDLKQERFKINALARHTLNLLIMENVDFSIDELKALAVSGLVRVNSSGDSSNDTYAANMIKLAHALVDTARVTIWTKNDPGYTKACDKYGKPKNLVLIKSSTIIGEPCALPRHFDYVFTVYFTIEGIKTALAAGACECNGKKCKVCGYKCYYGTWKGSNIAEVLR